MLDHPHDSRTTLKLGLLLSVLVLLGGLLLATTNCASLAGSDPVVVRAEDVLTNSLAFYQAAMSVHYANSKKESVELYEAMELVRTQFPPAWRSLRAAIPAYQGVRTGIEEKRLSEAILAVEKLVGDLREIWAGGM